MLDDTFMRVYYGKLKPEDAVKNGKIKIEGNRVMAMKLSVLFKEAKL